MFPAGYAMDPLHPTPGSLPGGRERGQNVTHLQNVHILTTTNQKEILLRPFVPSRELFHSVTSDSRVHGQGWVSRSESSTSLKCGTSVFSIIP